MIAAELEIFSPLHLIAIGGFLGVVVLAFATRHPAVQRVDDFIESHADPHRLFFRYAAGAATLTGEKFVHPVIALVSFLALCYHTPGSTIRFLAPLAVASLGGIITHHAVKFIYHRPRPEIALRRDKTEGAYPSGHTTNATAVVGTSVYLLVHQHLVPAAPAVAIAALLCMATGFSRVLLGWHWATDVLGGWMAGAGVAALASSLYWMMR